MKSTNRRSKYYVAGSTAVLFALTANVRAYDFPEISPRIVGGRDATKGDYPFFARWSKSCGATVIHDDILLTAAHVRFQRSKNAYFSANDNQFLKLNFCFFFF
jgi:secreted trypsin-like serine protease